MNLLKKLSMMLLMFTQSALLWAQEKKVDVSIDVDKGPDSDWYTQPWVWIVAGAVFILLLVALLKGKKD